MTLVKWILDVTGDRPLGANKIGFLYDIGCNVQKGIEKVILRPIFIH